MESSPIVIVNDGKIQGNQRTNIDGEKFYSFLAIPYAKPPVGDLRFKAPEPIEPWTDVKDATKVGDYCYQRHDYLFTLEGSEENCLHLNVFTRKLPSEEQKLKPVMVFIYGGGFISGCNDPNLYGPEHLLLEDIVLVVINYRVGFLGFFHLNDTTLEVPGNAGLKDQRLALQWVQKNIEHFNGDADNVTIFGESAGSACVHYHVVSSSSKGLFHKAIMQSGSLHNPWAHSDDLALEFAQSIRADVKTEKEALQLLRSLSVNELYHFQEKYCQFKGFWNVVAPNIEYPNQTAFITAPPTQLISSGQYNKVPILLGFTDREGLLFEGYNNAYKAVGIGEMMKVDLESLILPHQKLEKDDTERQLFAKKYADFYFQGENAKDKVMLLTDFFFVIGIVNSAIIHARTSPNPVYLYKMTVDAGLNVCKKMVESNEPGANHGDDLGYIFHLPVAAEVLEKGPLEDKVLRRFVKLWTNFAKTSNPTPQGNDLNITWKPVTENDVYYLDIGEELSLKTNPEPERIKFWRDLYQLSPFTVDYL